MTYVTKKHCEQKGYIKTDKGIYQITVLKKYLLKGFLKAGSKEYGEQDRYRAGLQFFKDFISCGFEGLSAFDVSKVKVDGGCLRNDRVYESRDRYFAAIKSIPREFWAVVRRVCLEDLEIEVADDLPDRRKLELKYALRRDLCRGLDRLVEFYIGE